MWACALYGMCEVGRPAARAGGGGEGGWEMATESVAVGRR